VSRALALAVCALAAPLALAEEPVPERGGIEIGYLNRTWTDLAGEAVPVEEGPLRVRLRSPQNRITLHRNRLALAPREGGDDPEARIEADFEGEGELVADVEGGRFSTSFTDRVSAPRQRVRVAGRARVTRDADAYHVALVDESATASVDVRSQAVARVLEFCEEVGWITGLDCGRLRRSLSRVQVPLGGPARALRLPRDRLGPEERAYLDRFVSQAPPPPAPGDASPPPARAPGS
jgi:hypothetical protein